MNFEFTEVMNDRQITLKYSIFDMMTQTFFVRLIWFDWDELEFKTFFFVLDYSTSIDHYFDSIHVIFNHHFYVFVFFFDFQKKTIQRGVTICFDYPLEMERAFIAFFTSFFNACISDQIIIIHCCEVNIIDVWIIIFHFFFIFTLL